MLNHLPFLSSKCCFPATSAARTFFVWIAPKSLPSVTEFSFWVACCTLVLPCAMTACYGTIIKRIPTDQSLGKLRSTRLFCGSDCPYWTSCHFYLRLWRCLSTYTSGCCSWDQRPVGCCPGSIDAAQRSRCYKATSWEAFTLSRPRLFFERIPIPVYGSWHGMALSLVELSQQALINDVG